MSEPIRPLSLVTGASSGIGAATARALAHQGHDLVLVAREPTALAVAAEACRHLGAQASWYATDVADPEQVKTLFRTLQSHKRLDNLVHCAGHMLDKPLITTSLHELNSLYLVHLQASFQLCQLASRLMVRQKQGNIVLLGSKVGESGASGQAGYASIKAAISGLTRALSKELGSTGIRVNAVAPGFIHTGMTAHYSDEQRAHLIQKISLGRLGQASEVASVIAFLCSSAASFMTGQILEVDGGFSL